MSVTTVLCTVGGLTIVVFSADDCCYCYRSVAIDAVKQGWARDVKDRDLYLPRPRRSNFETRLRQYVFRSQDVTKTLK